eukprot:m.235090 g.235090  ORF g.235090 m.235090 type:complete len:97 (-) comp54310_c2_seq2:2170-2460(-)
MVDVTVRSPLAADIIEQAAVTRLVAADEGVRAKNARYGKSVKSSDIFWPLALETFGGLHHNISPRPLLHTGSNESQPRCGVRIADLSHTSARTLLV